MAPTFCVHGSHMAPWLRWFPQHPTSRSAFSSKISQRIPGGIGQHLTEIFIIPTRQILITFVSDPLSLSTTIRFQPVVSSQKSTVMLLWFLSSPVIYMLNCSKSKPAAVSFSEWNKWPQGTSLFASDSFWVSHSPKFITVNPESRRCDFTSNEQVLMVELLSFPRLMTKKTDETFLFWFHLLRSQALALKRHSPLPQFQVILFFWKVKSQQRAQPTRIGFRTLRLLAGVHPSDVLVTCLMEKVAAANFPWASVGKNEWVNECSFSASCGGNLC